MRERLFAWILSVGLFAAPCELALVPVYAADGDYFGGAEDVMDPMPQQQQQQLPSPPGYQGQPYYNGQPYINYPTQPGYMVPVQPQKKSFLGRLFSPVTKKMSPPINQAPKFPKDVAKETKPIPDPLVRLGKGINYDGQSISPGYYLLGVENAAGKTPYLLLMKQQQQLIKVPAKAESVAEIESLPDPPKDKDGKPKPPEAKASVALSQDGKAVVLTYQKGKSQYVSEPISVDEAYQK